MTEKSVVLFYKYFVPADTPQILRDNDEYYAQELEKFSKNLCQKLGLKGRLLISTQGINGTVSANSDAILQQYIDAMKRWDALEDCPLPPSLSSRTAPALDKDIILSRLFEHVDWKTSRSKVEISSQAAPALDKDIIISSRLFEHVDWKTSRSKVEPFPDLKISRVKELVSTGGSISVESLTPEHQGKHLSPQEFHEILSQQQQQQQQQQSSSPSSQNKDIVLVDVRNTFEHEIGHFVNPVTGEKALNPEMVTFSSFDSNFCAKRAEELKDKKVMLFCTGGIRCETASVMLKQRGVEDVNQLQGGIHRYLEEFGTTGYFQGKNFVFDRRIAMEPDEKEGQPAIIVGHCLECEQPYDELCGSRLCTVCRDLILICQTCWEKRHEFHCRRHQYLKDCYFTFLEGFTIEELKQQVSELSTIRQESPLLQPHSSHKNARRTLQRQVDKIERQIARLESGDIQVIKNPARRCRTCMELMTMCDGKCWGFWKTKTDDDEWVGGQGEKRKLVDLSARSPLLPISIGDEVEPGPNWNVLRLGDKKYPDGRAKRGKVVEVKSWAGGEENNCVCVVWDDPAFAGGNRRNKPIKSIQAQIYRWGLLALDGITRLYDVQKVGCGSSEHTARKHN
jgi:predicted sulfurtransferase